MWLFEETKKFVGNAAAEVSKHATGAAEAVISGSGAGKVFEKVTGTHIQSNVYDNGVQATTTIGGVENKMGFKLGSSGGDFSGEAKESLKVNGEEVVKASAQVD